MAAAPDRKGRIVSDPELVAMQEIVEALADLTPRQRLRVTNWIAQKSSDPEPNVPLLPEDS